MQRKTIKVGQETILLDMDDQVIFDEMKPDEFYEHPMLRAIYAMIAHKQIRNDLFVDCGANFGNHTVFFSKFCAKKVIAFEPVPQTFDLLQLNCHQNNCENVVLHQAGLSDKQSRGNIDKDPSWRWSQAKILPDKKGSVQLFTLDHLRLYNCSLIKIDVEDMELHVLSGAMGTIKRFLPDIFVEVWNEESLTIIKELLYPHGYELKERYNHAPTYHYSANSDIPVTYTKP